MAVKKKRAKRAKKVNGMTRPEFEAEFQKHFREGMPSITGSWADYVHKNLYLLSDTALRYIIANEGNPFGSWLVNRAVELTAFEDYVLKSK